MRLVCLVFIAAALPLAARAQEKAPEKAGDAGVIYPRPAGTDSRAEAASAGRGGGYGGMLAAALLLAVAGGWLFWRGRGVPGANVNGRKLSIAETKSLGGRQYLVVAAYEDKKFLLSVCPGRIELLTPLEETSPANTP